MTQTIHDLLKRGNNLTEKLKKLGDHREVVRKMAYGIRYDSPEDSTGSDPCMSNATLSLYREGWHRFDLSDEFIPSKKDLIATYLLNLDNKIKAVEKELNALIPPAPEELPEPKRRGPKKKK